MQENTYNHEAELSKMRQQLLAERRQRSLLQTKAAAYESRQFNPREISQLKDVLLLTLATNAHSPMDVELAELLIEGKDIPDRLLQHTVDEAREIPIPAAHKALLAKILNRLQGPA